MFDAEIFTINGIKIVKSNSYIPYTNALDCMENEVKKIIEGLSLGFVWLLEHKPVYTLGTSFKDDELLKLNEIDICKTNRGGKATYHGPGQRVIYFVIDLKKLQGAVGVPDIKKYVCSLEALVINSLAKIDVKAERRQGRIGVWIVDEKGREQKIAAIGVRMRKGVVMHGVAINVLNNPNDDFSGIVPCGISNYGVCSLKTIGKDISIEDFDKILLSEIEALLNNYNDYYVCSR